MKDILSYPDKVRLNENWEPFVLGVYPEFHGVLTVMGYRDGTFILKNSDGKYVTMSEAYLRRCFEIVKED